MAPYITDCSVSDSALDFQRSISCELTLTYTPSVIVPEIQKIKMPAGQYRLIAGKLFRINEGSP